MKSEVDRELERYAQQPNVEKHAKHMKPKNATSNFLTCFMNCIYASNTSTKINVKKLHNRINKYYLLAFIKLGLVKIYKASDSNYISIKFTSLGSKFDGEFCQDINQIAMLPYAKSAIFWAFMTSLVIGIIIGSLVPIMLIFRLLISFAIILISGLCCIFEFRKYYRNHIVRNHLTLPRIIQFFKTVGLNSFEIKHKLGILKHYNLMKPYDKEQT